MISKKKIASAVKQEMGRRNLTIEQLTEITQMSRSTIVRVLSPKKIDRVKYDSLIKILEALQIDIEEKPVLYDEMVVKENHLQFHQEEAKKYGIISLSQLIIYFPVILQVLPVFTDFLYRMDGDFYRPRDCYDLRQLKRLYDFLPDSSMKRFADYLCYRASHEYEPDSEETEEYYEDSDIQLGMEDYRRILSKLNTLSYDFQKYIDTALFTK